MKRKGGTEGEGTAATRGAIEENGDFSPSLIQTCRRTKYDPTYAHPRHTRGKLIRSVGRPELYNAGTRFPVPCRLIDIDGIPPARITGCWRPYRRETMLTTCVE